MTLGGSLLCFWTVLKLYLFIVNVCLAVEAVISVVDLWEISCHDSSPHADPCPSSLNIMQCLHNISVGWP